MLKMATKRLVSQVFNHNPQGIRLRGRPIRDVGTVYKQTLIRPKLKTGKRGKNRSDWEKAVKGAKVRIGL